MNPFDLNQPQPPAPSVIETKAAPDGTVWDRYSDGSVRQRAVAAPAPVAAPPPAASPGFGVPLPGAPVTTMQPGFAPPMAAPPPQPGAPSQPWAPFAGQPSAAPPTAQSAGAAPQALPEYVDTDEMVAGGKPPLGSFDVRLATCSGDRSKANNRDTQQPWHMVSLSLEIVAGSDTAGANCVGREIRKTYLLDPRFNQKTGKWNSGGVAEIRDDLAKLGTPLQPGFRFPTNETQAAQIVGSALAGRVFRILSFEQKRMKNVTENGVAKKVEDTRTEVKIVGPAGTSAMAATGTGGANGMPAGFAGLQPA